MKQPISIRPLGGFFATDAAGFLLNPCSLAHYGEDDWRLLNFCYRWVNNQLGSRLHSFWLRGSRARPGAVSPGADLDLFVVIADSEMRHWTPIPGDKQLQRLVEERFGISQLECMMSGLYVDGMPHPRLAMIMATQSILLAGVDIRKRLPKYRIDASILFHFRWLETDYTNWQRRGMNEEEERSFLKNIIRIAREITQPRSGRYSPDLFYCCSEFSHYYPTRSSDLWQLLWHYLHPHLAQARATACVHRVVPFLLQEIKIHLSVGSAE